MSHRTVLITGCSSGGIGSALAREFHSKGLRVFATSRTIESMQDLSALGIEILALDVTDVQAIQRTRDDIAARTGGKLDILVNNAGHAYPVAAIDMDMSAVRALFEVNLFAPMSMVQQFAPLLIASGSGCIVNIGSVSGIMPIPFSAAYNTSKAALHAFGNTLRVELAPFNINVLNVITGGVKSNIVKPHTIPDTSLYKSMEQVYQKQRITVSQQDATDTAVYARTVVEKSSRRIPDWFMKKKFGFLAFSLNLRQKAKDKTV